MEGRGGQDVVKTPRGHGRTASQNEVGLGQVGARVLVRRRVCCR
jgi:hypothetical protein